MSFLRPVSAATAVEALLVGFLLIFVDLPLGSFDIVPDVLGWVIAARALQRLRRDLPRVGVARMVQSAQGLVWAAAVMSGAQLLYQLLFFFGLGFSLTSGVLGLIAVILAFTEVVALLAAAAVVAVIAEAAAQDPVDPTTHKLLRAGWIIALVAAAAHLLTLLGVAAVAGIIIRLLTFAAGIVSIFGISRWRNEASI